MEGSQNDTHSDSDSGESWTLLEASPSYAATPSPCPSPAVSAAASNGDAFDGADKDEDTDGISIISDSESESIAACEHASRDDNLSVEPPEETSHLQEENLASNVSATPEPINTLELDESTRCDDYYGNSHKLKTYVHRRNNKVSSMLNVILLGSVITAAGIALGHIWGVRDDCSLQTTPSVNKILSNLYKLQEENAFLRSKLKELTLAGQLQFQQKKTYAEKLASAKLNKCKKAFEEPLQSANVVKTTKCIDLEADVQRPSVEFKKTDLTLPVESINENAFESAIDETNFRDDVKKLKQIYKENRNWLDPEIAKRLRNEELLVKPQYSKKSSNPKGERYESENKNNEKNEDIKIEPKRLDEAKDLDPVKIVSYADSVKYGINKHSLSDEDNIHKGEVREIKSKYRPASNSVLYQKKQEKMEIEESDEDDEIARDNRYSPNKRKHETNKVDRQKPYRKHKRENKYEQWEMKGGYMKNYDSITTLSSQENVKPIKDSDKNHLSQEWERVNYMDTFSDGESRKNNEKPTKGESNTGFVMKSKITADSSEDSKKYKNNRSTDDSIGVNWFEKRSAHRRQAREQLEKDNPMRRLKGSARWYFSRMSEREQRRARVNHSTGRNAPRRNYKTTH